MPFGNGDRARSGRVCRQCKCHRKLEVDADEHLSSELGLTRRRTILLVYPMSRPVPSYSEFTPPLRLASRQRSKLPKTPRTWCCIKLPPSQRDRNLRLHLTHPCHPTRSKLTRARLSNRNHSKMRFTKVFKKRSPVKVADGAGGRGFVPASYVELVDAPAAGTPRGATPTLGQSGEYGASAVALLLSVGGASL